MSVWAIVLAAGRAQRFGSAKQLEDLCGATVVQRALTPAQRTCDGVVLVVPSGESSRWPQGVTTVNGGTTRSESVRCGLDAVPSEADVIVVHDAARPAATSNLFELVVHAVRAGADGAVPGTALTDTVKHVEGAVVVETVDRNSLVAVQTPQAFRADVLRVAHSHGGDATDDAALVEARGGRVVVVPGDPDNAKITTPADLDAMRARLGERR